MASVAGMSVGVGVTSETGVADASGRMMVNWLRCAVYGTVRTK